MSQSSTTTTVQFRLYYQSHNYGERHRDVRREEEVAPTIASMLENELYTVTRVTKITTTHTAVEELYGE